MKRKKIAIIMLVTGLILILVGVVVFVTTLKTENKYHVMCIRKEVKTINTIISSTYEFYYTNEVLEPIKNLIIKYDDYETYKNDPIIEDYEKPFEVVNDVKKLTRYYVSYKRNPPSKEGLSLNEYIKELEADPFLYECEVL